MIKSDDDPTPDFSQYQHLYDNSPLAIALIDLNATIIDINPATEKLLGFKRDELVGKSYLKLSVYPEEVLVQSKKRFQLISEGHVLEPVETQIYDKARNLIWINALSLMVKFGDKTLIQIVIQDINKRKIMEQKLKASEEKYRSLINNIMDIFLELELDGTINYISPQVNTILGYSAESVMGLNAFDFIHPDDLKRVRKTIEEAIQWGTYASFDHRVKHKAGYYIPISTIGSLVSFEGSNKMIGVLRDLSYQKEAKRRIKESEAKYKEIMDNLDVGFYRISLEEEIMLSHNPTFNKIFGYDPVENLTGQRQSDLWIDSKERDKYFEQLLKDGQVSNFVGKMRKIDGIEIVVQGNSHLVFNSDGEPIALEGTVIDVTEKYYLEQKVKESEEKYRYLFEQSLYGIMILNMDAQIVDINPTLEQITGYGRDELLNMDFFDLAALPKEMLPLLRKRFQLYTSGKELKRIELEIFKKDRKKIWINPSVSLINLGGEPLIQIQLQDITYKKVSEALLKESEEKFRTIAEHSFMGISILQDDVFKYTNQQFSDFIGYSIEEILNWGPGAFMNVIHPEYKEIVAKQAEIKQSGGNDPLINYQIKGMRKDGATIWADVYSNTIHYQGKTADLITCLDITEKKKTEEILLEAERIIKNENIRLKQLNMFRKDFINRASHELKNPLSAIYGASELLKVADMNKNYDDISELIDMVNKNAYRLKELIVELLDVSRLESENLVMEKEITDLNKLIKASIEEMDFFIKERQIDLVVNLQENINLNVNPERIQQVFTNLLSNAIKYSPIQSKVEIKSIKNHEYIEIQVIDNGIGITKEEKKELFKEFSKLKRQKSYASQSNGSTGLGLYLSKKIVKLHGGKITAESDGKDKGTTFRVRLPLA